MNIIVAVCKGGGIGKDGKIPWKIKKDLEWFKKETTRGEKNAVIMGRKTWESLPFKPLPDRKNIVLSSLSLPDVECVKSFEEALKIVKEYDNIYVIGGEKVYKEALKHKLLKYVYITYIYESFPCDRFFKYPILSTRKKQFKLEKISRLMCEKDIFFDHRVYKVIDL